MEKKIPQRMCIACREMKNKRELLRITFFDGKISFDPTSKAPGRGAYVCSSKDCINKAFKNRIFEKSFEASFGAEEKNNLLESLLKIVDG